MIGLTLRTQTQLKQLKALFRKYVQLSRKKKQVMRLLSDVDLNKPWILRLIAVLTILILSMLVL